MHPHILNLKAIKIRRNRGDSYAKIGRDAGVSRQAVFARIRYVPTKRAPTFSAACNWLFSQYKRKARARRHSWSLSKRRFALLIRGLCHYCGVSPSNRCGEFQYSGIDRKINSQGYRIGNVVSCCGRCNRMKGTMSAREFIGQARRISKVFA
jgi:hypothetical protein